MKTGQNKIQIQTRSTNGFTAVINPGPLRSGKTPTRDQALKHLACDLAYEPVSEPSNFCLACPTEIAPEDNFCAHCYSQIPDHLTGAWFNCRTQNGRLLALQGMVDHLARLKEGPVPVPGLVDSQLLADIIVFLDQVRSDCLSAGQDAAPHTVKHINKLLARIEEATRSVMACAPDASGALSHALEALKVIEQLTRGTLSTHVHKIASNAIAALTPSPQRGEGQGEEAL